jgi:hypothetical protein
MASYADRMRIARDEMLGQLARTAPLPVRTIARKAIKAEIEEGGFLVLTLPVGSEFHARAANEAHGCPLNVRFVVASPEPTYSEYLQSDHWQHMRELAREHYGDACCLCGSLERIETHHRTYDRIGRERLSDLTRLCRPCHSKFHDKLP